MSSPRSGRLGVRYEFLLAGSLDETSLSAFPDLTASAGPAGGTVLYGPVEDSSQLHGLLARFQTMGIEVVEMRQLPD